MEENKIESGNLIIMLFDGWELKTRQTFDPENNTQNPGSNNYGVYIKNSPLGEITCRPEDVQHNICYHKFWDAQIPVYSKLAKMLYDINRPYLLAMHNSYIQAITENNPIMGFEIIIENIKFIKERK